MSEKVFSRNAQIVWCIREGQFSSSASACFC